MNEVTPDLVAQIATRLFNEVPGTPAPSTPLPEFAPALPVRPEPPAIPAGNSIPFLELPFNAPATVPTSIPIPPSATSFSDPARFGSFSLPTEQPPQDDRLRNFIQQIRTSHVHSRDGLCADAPEQNFLFRSLSSGRTTATGPRPFDVEAVRKDFPALHQQIHGKPLVWLDNAATTQKPQSVIDTLSNYYSRDNSNIHRAAHTLAARSTDAYEQAREKVQRFIGAGSVNEIVFVRGTTEGINLIAQTYGRKFLQPGDEIVMSTLEHHANIVPWQMVAKERGAVIRVIPVNDRGEVMLEQYQALLSPRTRLVALTHASNSLGTILPIAEMIAMAKRFNARVLIDAAQSIAHLPINVQQLDLDFLVFSGHKIFGPTGIGAVFAKEELLEIMPPWQGGGNMIKTVTFEETTYNPPPARFEAGTPNIADAVGLGAALDYVSRLGLPNISKHEHALLEYGTEKLLKIDGLRLIGTAREKVGVLSFVLPNRKTESIGKALDAEGIAVRAGHHCAQPSLRRFGLEATVRPSISLYNTHDDIDRLADAIRRIMRMS